MLTEQEMTEARKLLEDFESSKRSNPRKVNWHKGKLISWLWKHRQQIIVPIQLPALER